MRHILLLVIVGGMLSAPELLAGSVPVDGPAFPLPLHAYGDGELTSVPEILRHRINVEPLNLAATIIFLLAIVHTFLAAKFTHLAHLWRDEHAAKIRARGSTAESTLP